MSHVFVSYVREDNELVNELCYVLRANGIKVWLDRNELKPGQRWQSAIRRAIREGAFFVACFSQSYVERKKSYMNEELTLAVDELRQRPTDVEWFIPIALSENAVPDRDIGGGQTLHDLQWVNLSSEVGSPPWKREVSLLVKTLTPAGSTPTVDQLIDRVRQSVVERSEEQLSQALVEIVSNTIDAAIDEFINGTDEAIYDYSLRPVCKEFGQYFTKQQVVRMATRGGRVHGLSRTGFHGLDILYGEHFEHMKELQLPLAFSENEGLCYYCKLREKFPGMGLHQIISPGRDKLELIIDGITVDIDYYWDKHITRGTSAFLDALEKPNKANSS
jgi:hypothetical protein